MESLPNNEQIERRAELVARLEEKGDADLAVKELLDQWTAAEEATRQAQKEPGYLLTMELARIFEEARWPGRANELLALAAEDAWNTGDMETYEKIEKVLEQ